MQYNFSINMLSTELKKSVTQSQRPPKFNQLHKNDTGSKKKKKKKNVFFIILDVR